MKMLRKIEEITFVEIQVARQAALTLLSLRPFNRYTLEPFALCDIVVSRLHFYERADDG